MRSSAFAICFLVGCAGELEDPDAFDPVFVDECATVTQELFANSCNGCHNGEIPSGGLDLEASPASGHSGSCGVAWINPASPRESLLYMKLIGNPRCGARMPVGGAAIDRRSLDCLLTWIAAQP